MTFFQSQMFSKWLEMNSFNAQLFSDRKAHAPNVKTKVKAIVVQLELAHLPLQLALPCPLYSPHSASAAWLCARPRASSAS